jgi:hypothetical protein
VAPFATARVLVRAFKRAPKKEFMAFAGGTGAGDPCEWAAAHGFMGIDDEVVRAIAGWIKEAR